MTENTAQSEGKVSPIGLSAQEKLRILGIYIPIVSAIERMESILKFRKADVL